MSHTDLDRVERYPEELTPILTNHARERCAQMGISTKVAKRIWRHRSLTRPLAGQARVIVTSPTEPDYALVVDPLGPTPIVVTVLFAEEAEYERLGSTYRIIGGTDVA